MEIREITQKDIWENFVKSRENNSILQSWGWGEFEKAQGHEIFRLGLFEGETLLGVSLVTKVISRRANYLTTHAGPLVSYDDSTQFDAFHEYLITLAKKENLDFVRIRLPLEHSDQDLKSYLQKGYKLAPMYFHAEHTIVLDLNPSEDELLHGMRKNTRYSVRKGAKQDVEVRFTSDETDIDPLYEVYVETVQRQQFIPYNREFFLAEFNAFVHDKNVEIGTVTHNGQVVSSAMFIYYDKTAYYHHSGSVRTDPDVFANYTLQWEFIKRAKQRGIQKYDFWGVAPDDDSEHPRAGLTLFKRGFGGDRVRWMHTMDYPIKPLKYWLMWAYVKLERLKRKL